MTAITDTKVQCRNCQRSERVRFATCLQRGWPECCGEAMLLIDTTASVSAAVDELLASLTRARKGTAMDEGQGAQAERSKG